MTTIVLLLFTALNAAAVPAIDTSNVLAIAESTSSPYFAALTADGSGLTGDLHDNDDDNMWLSAPDRGTASYNPNPGTVTGVTWLRFQFDKVYKLGDMWIWNCNETAWVARGFKDVTIEYSTTGGSSPSEWHTLGEYELAQASGAATIPHTDEIHFDGV